MSKTNIGLVEYAKAQLGKPYWFGCYGQIATETLYQAKKRQYPNYYTATNFTSQYKQRVYDCIGLIKGYLWSDTLTSIPKYNADQDVNANTMSNRCTMSGTITTIPNIPGILVFMNNHVGVYIGNGYVIEARGHAYGVVQTKLSNRGWLKWGYCPWIEYVTKVTNSAKEICGVELDKLFKGSKGNSVKALQLLLIGNGYNCGVEGADGSFGSKTDAAVRVFQKNKSITVDGIVGKTTWSKLLR